MWAWSQGDVYTSVLYCFKFRCIIDLIQLSMSHTGFNLLGTLAFLHLRQMKTVSAWGMYMHASTLRQNSYRNKGWEGSWSERVLKNPLPPFIVPVAAPPQGQRTHIHMCWNPQALAPLPRSSSCAHSSNSTALLQLWTKQCIRIQWFLKKNGGGGSDLQHGSFENAPSWKMPARSFMYVELIH